MDGGEAALLEHLVGIPMILIETHAAGLEAHCIAFLAKNGYRTTVIPNARWRSLYPEWRPIEINRWLFAEREGTETRTGSRKPRR